MSVVDEVKSRLDLIELVSGYVPTLKKAGRTYKGLCPFHSEKTPSFVVYPDSQTWHCFGACGVGGDVYGFVMRREGLDFRGALELLADRAGVSLQPQSAEMAEANKAQQRLLDLMAAAAAYYHDLLLKSPQGEGARQYLAKRGLQAEVISQFQLGYALDAWDGAKDELMAKGYSEADLVEAGLLVVREETKAIYDRFRHRLMIPIRDLRGRVIGFGARALRDDQVPKYLNSPQTALFDKGAVIYGLDMARSAIREAGQVVIVEGYMDVLQAHQQGHKNVVAQMGTALTEPQLKLLQRHTKTMVLALDADTAGSSATLRGINTAREVLGDVVPVPTAQGLIRYESRLNVDIRVVTLPPGRDPDDILKQDATAWPTLVQSALPLLDYVIQQTVAGLDMATPRGKSQAVQTILPLIREVSDTVQQVGYLQQLASLVKIDERTLRTELQRVSPSRSETTHPWSNTPIQAEPLTKKGTELLETQLEEHCLAILVGYPDGLLKVDQRLQDHQEGQISANDFLKSENQALFRQIRAWSTSQSADLDSLLGVVDETLEGHLASVMALWHQQPQTPSLYLEKDLLDTVIRLRLERLKRQSTELREMQQTAYETRDKLATTEYMTLMGQVKVRLDRLNKLRNAFSILGRRRVEER